MSELLSQEEMEDLGLEAEQVNFVWFLIKVLRGLFLFIINQRITIYVSWEILWKFQVDVLKKCFDGFADEEGAIPAENVGNILSLMGLKVKPTALKNIIEEIDEDGKHKSSTNVIYL